MSRPMMGSIKLALLLVTCLPPRHASAQGALPNAQESRFIMPFLEGTDVFISPDGRTGVDGTIFEANIYPHLIVWQNFTDAIAVQDEKPAGEPRTARARRVDDTLHRIRWSVSGTPAVRIRMFKDVSDPVRTPSYMPRVNVQALWARDVPGVLERANRKREGTAAKHPALGLWEAHVIVGHHSNGQDGCFYTMQTRPTGRTPKEELPCEPEVVPANAETAKALVNRRDGSFSTNYVRAGMNYRLNWIDADTLVAFRELSIGAEVEEHPARWMDEHEVNLYGRTRINSFADYAIRGTEHICPARAEGRFSANYIVGAPSTVSDWTLSGQVSCFPTSSGGWGVFARYYRGQDYYNIAFLNQIRRWELGATFNQDGFFRFRRVQSK